MTGMWEASMAASESLDCRNLLCPMPVIRTQAAVAGMAAGDELEIVATDPGVLEDIPAWSRVHGHEVIETRDSGQEIYVRLRVGSG